MWPLHLGFLIGQSPGALLANQSGRIFLAPQCQCLSLAADYEVGKTPTSIGLSERRVVTTQVDTRADQDPAKSRCGARCRTSIRTVCSARLPLFGMSNVCCSPCSSRSTDERGEHRYSPCSPCSSSEHDEQDERGRHGVSNSPLLR